MGYSILGGAEYDLGLIAAGHAAQMAKEFKTVHDRHVPVEQDRIGQSALAGFQRLLAVLGFDDLEIQAFQDAPCNFSADAPVIYHKTYLHSTFLSTSPIP